MLQHPITGSYRAEDCQFLLTPLQLELREVERKEQLIQSGTKHYSEMLSPEYAPSAHYLTLFRTLTARYRQRLAGEVLALARYLHLQQPDFTQPWCLWHVPARQSVHCLGAPCVRYFSIQYSTI